MLVNDSPLARLVSPSFFLNKFILINLYPLRRCPAPCRGASSRLRLPLVIKDDDFCRGPPTFIGPSTLVSPRLLLHVFIQLDLITLFLASRLTTHARIQPHLPRINTPTCISETFGMDGIATRPPPGVYTAPFPSLTSA